MSGTSGAPMRGVQLSKPIGIYYEHPDWYRPLFQQLDARGVNWKKIHAGEHSFDVALREPEYSLIFNRMSPSAWQRGLGHVIFYTLNYLQHLEAQGVRVVNGSRAFTHETSTVHARSRMKLPRHYNSPCSNRSACPIQRRW